MITPKYPTQAEIDQALQKLTPKNQEKYKELKALYEAEIKKDVVDHEKIKEYIKAATELLNSTYK